ncbi:MAG: hypothetical protein IKT52_01370 [Oscillospiraceae bacterium]|nr:hypothetical protein [Oscillospiraceae bacterium]
MADFEKLKKWIRSRRGKLLVVLLAAVVLASSAWGASARYVHKSGGSGVIKAQEFYFTSNYLTPFGASYTLNPGTGQVEIELRNYDGKKVSELDITYTVLSNGTAVEDGSGTLTANAENTAQVTIKDLQPGVPYTVTAKGENGYSRTLSATFTVKAPAEGIYKHTEIYEDYVLLTIWTQGVAGTATVTIPDGLTPDYTDAALEGKSAGGTVNADLEADESVSYRFFITGAYNKAAIDVTSGGTSLEETALS